MSSLLAAVLSFSPTQDSWVLPKGLADGHNGGQHERLTAPVADKKPHILMILFDDYGWADAGWHRDYTAPGGEHVPATPEVSTPNLNALVKQGIDLDRHYVYKYCSPSRSALQSGRNPYHVNPLNAEPEISNPDDPVSGFAAIPRNMTGIATKMAAAGYKTAAFGKWDAGMATPDHTPHGRGYQTAMNYFHHCNDYWSMVDGIKCNAGTDEVPRKVSIVDLWRKDGATTYEGPAHMYNNSCVVVEPAGQPPAGECVPGPKGDAWYGGYEDSLLEQQVLQTIAEHDAAEPLFLFWAPHIVHTPLQLPDSYMEQFDFIAPTDKPTHQRQRYHAMVHFADAMVGNVTAALREKGMWDDLLIVFSTDNGGPIYYNGSAGANNFPLKGGKMNNWEGGIRGNAFVSGGFVPAAMRGSKYEGLVTLWDWYATFSALAGVDAADHRAAKAQLPPIDSHDMSAVILGKNLTSPRTEIPIGTEPRASNLTNAPLCSSYNGATPYYDDPHVLGDEIAPAPKQGRCTTVSGIIVDEGAAGLWKLLTGDVEQDMYTGPHYPNATTDEISNSFVGHCALGCLYNLRDDPLETHDLAATMPAKAAALRAKVEAYETTAFNPDRGNVNPAACDNALGKYGGFWGPFLA